MLFNIPQVQHPRDKDLQTRRANKVHHEHDVYRNPTVKNGIPATILSLGQQKLLTSLRGKRRPCLKIRHEVLLRKHATGETKCKEFQTKEKNRSDTSREW